MNYNIEHELPQRVENIINEFYASDDEDIKYMILKKPIQWDVVEDLNTYFDKIVKPVFSEASSDITNLLSSEVLPHIFENDLEPFINTLLESLLVLFGELLEEERKSVVLQSIKSVLSKFINKNQNLNTPITVHKDYISPYIEILKGNGYDISHKILFRDILRLLIDVSYQHVISIELMKEILQTTSTENEFDPVTRQLLNDSFKLVNYKDVPELSELITLSQLVLLSEKWYKFNKVPDVYYKFIKQNVEDIKMKQFDEVKDALNDILTIIINFKPLLFTKSYSLKKTIETGFKSNIPLYLQTILNYLHCVKKKDQDHMHMDKEGVNIDGGFAEEDVAQQDYLNELQTDTDNFEEEDDPFTFEDDLTSTLENMDHAKDDKISQLIAIIEDIQDEFQKYEKTVKGLDEKESPEEINHVIDVLNNSKDYNEIYCMIDLVENIVKDPVFDKMSQEKQLELYSGLLSRLKRNKEFVKVLKVGNMKQKIDEGLDIRITIYSILIQTKDTVFKYTLACMILEAIATFGVKEKDPSILSQIVTLYKKIMTQYETYLEGIDPKWFETNIVYVIMDQNTDLYHLILHN